MTLIGKYTSWLHTRWPAGLVEKLPLCNEVGATAVPGLYIVGDLTGIPLLKFSADTGAKVVQTIVTDPSFGRRRTNVQVDGHAVLDLLIIGGGVSGMAAALEAKKNGLGFQVLEATEAFSTIVNFPKQKPIYTYPTEMTPAGELQFSPAADVKESLLDELRAQTIDQGITPIIARAERVTRRDGVLAVSVQGGENLYAHRVIVSIGQSGNFRKLGVPGENLDKVYNRLHDPKDFCDKNVLVVGGGDSALETAIAIAACGGNVTLSYRKPQFSRPKPENIEKISAPVAGTIRLMLGSRVKQIRERDLVVTNADGHDETIKNDAVFSMIGREAPLDFFRRSGVPIRGEWRPTTWLAAAVFVLSCFWLYHWKTGKPIPLVGALPYWLNPQPARLWSWLSALSEPLADQIGDPATLLGTLAVSGSDPSFFYALLYSIVVVVFGIRRIRRRRTPYVKVQTLTLMAIQCLPLFVLPEILLPLAGNNGWFDGGVLQSVADSLFPIVDYGHGREYWRAYGFVLAWPLMAWNFFTNQPLWGWLIIGSIQTFVMIPALVYFFGKGAYCGWICSCGALAETLGDTHRHKMPHGPKYNRLNMVGQVVLAWSFVLMAVRIAGWMWPTSVFARLFELLADKAPILNYKWLVDIMLAGVIGYGLYFWFSGRVWCRFACPLAALMHIYARFSRFRIFADKKKCISCNVCTTVCHQGIDVMNFANKGEPMEDPQCVRCSACVQSCPTGVLSFGQIDRKTGTVLCTDRLAASPVQMVELTMKGAALS